MVDLDIVLEVVTQLENLELLDISKEEEPEDVNYRWKVGNKDLKLLLGLPNLSALDLSRKYIL